MSASTRRCVAGVFRALLLAASALGRRRRGDRNMDTRAAGDPRGTTRATRCSFAGEADRFGNAQELDRQLLAVSNEMSKLNRIVTRCIRGSALRRCAGLRTMRHAIRSAVALRMLQRISDDAENVALADERAQSRRRWRWITLHCLQQGAKPQMRLKLELHQRSLPATRKPFLL